MITIHPIQNNCSTCPSCNSENTETKRILYSGIHIAASCICVDCGYEFIQDLPVGHACYYPTSIGIKDKKVFDAYKIDWFTTQFIHSYNNPDSTPIVIERQICNVLQDVIIINCLDYLYGHVLLKLFNVSFYKKQHPTKGIVVLVPANYTWLVPDFVDEVWSVKLKLSQFKKWYTSIDTTIAEWVRGYQTVDLAYCYPHPQTEEIDIESYTSVKPFNLNTFQDKNVTVTFVYRTDRLWHQSKAEYYLFLMLRKLSVLKFVSFLFPGMQEKSIKRLAKLLRKAYPSMLFNVIGIGKKGGLGADIQDLRTEQPTDIIEKKWCEAYANSHVVVGIHGSNMLLPTAHAAAFIELLPMDRVGNLTQDIITRYEGRTALYLGRFIPDTASPKLLASQIHSLIKGWPLFELYNDRKHQFFESDKQLSFLKNLRKSISRTFN